MTPSTARCSAPFLLLCLALAVGGGGWQSAGLQAAAAAGIPGLSCSALVDTDQPEQWQPVGDVPSVRLAAHTLLIQHYGKVGGPAACGPLVSSPDTDILILGACSKGDLTALLFYARFVCKKKTCAGGKPCIYGAKLLGTARTLTSTDPRVTQLDAVSAEPSVAPQQGTGAVLRAGGSYIRANFKQTQLAALPYKDLLARGTGGSVKVYLKSGGVWRRIAPNPASFGSGYPRLPAPSKAPTAASSAAQPAALPTCLEITGVAGFDELARSAPPSLYAESVQAAVLAYFSTVNKTATTACPQSQANGQVRLGAVLVDAMRVCQKATAAGVAYGLRFTAYFPCIKGQGRFAVLDATAFQPGPTHEAAFGPTEVLSQPPNSTAGIGRGADVGISGRTRLFAKFTRVSSIQAMDIAVDPADPTIIWVVGPEDAASVNPACGKPYGGPLLKWDWASSSFKPTASAKGAGYRVTIMPGVKKPWIVDGCGQLSGWGQGWKRLYGPAPQGQLFDIAAVNGTVFSGCGSYNPSTFEGDIAAGCLLSAAVGPNRELHTSDAGDVAVMADGRELLANEQHVLYKDPALDQFFRAYRAPDGYHPVRIAAGSNGSVWLVVGPPTTPMLTTRAARLAGVYRGFLHTSGSNKPPNWPKTCADVDPGCADGGCNVGLTRCVRCASPQFVMGANGKCRPLVCTDVDPNCAKCGEGTMCITCAPGFVRGYHSGDTLCRRPVTGAVHCWRGVNGSTTPTISPNTSTWQYVSGLGPGVGQTAFVDTQGNVWVLNDGSSDTIAFLTASSFRTVSYMPYNGQIGWHGLTRSGKLAHFDAATRSLVPSSILGSWPSQAKARLLAFDAKQFDGCAITENGRAACSNNMYGEALTEVAHVHSVCILGDYHCFLSVYGDFGCWGRGRSLPVPPPREGERWVELACGTSLVCLRATSGAVRCFPITGNQFARQLQLPGNYSTLAVYDLNDRQRVCGVTMSNKLHCEFGWKEGIFEKHTSVDLGPGTKWSMVAVFYERVCAISPN